jgi:omega-amidase
MKDLTITLVQANQIWENKEGNFENYKRLVSNIVETDLILLPEMFNTGFSMNTELLAEPFNDSLSINWLQELAKEKNAAIYTSLIIEENKNYYNRGVFVEPSGKLTIYDKQKTFGLAGEDKFFSKGEKTTILNYLGWNIRLQICYDLRFPEISLNKLVNGLPQYDLLLYVANWPERRNHHWRSLLPARAIENQCYLAAVNRVGNDNTGLSYSGDSCVIDLLGNRLTDIVSEEMITSVKLSFEELKNWRQKLPFLKDREIENKKSTV